ncbi:MAG: ribonuclease P protein component [Candidatus Dojkabacteria bacterium]|nr:ribonuclease P protein component [Candidatus Dojkabacteria bacterium]
MPKKYSLKKRKEIENLFNDCSFFSNSFFRIVYKPNSDLKILISIPKRIQSKSVRRNKIKRRIRHILYPKLIRSKILKPGYYGIIVRQDIYNTEFSKIKANLINLLMENNLLEYSQNVKTSSF